MKNTGDGFLAVFESPLDAVECAIELQQEILARESQHSPERRIAFRIGIHWEPVIFDLDDVYGSAVNIAARLQTTAPADGIVVSSAVLDNLDGAGDLKFDSLGDLRLKNLTRAVPAFSLRLPGVDRGAAVGFASPPSRRAKLPQSPSCRSSVFQTTPAIIILPRDSSTTSSRRSAISSISWSLPADRP